MSLKSLLKKLILEEVGYCGSCQGQKPRLYEADETGQSEFDKNFPDINYKCMRHDWVAQKMNEEIKRAGEKKSEDKAIKKAAKDRGKYVPYYPVYNKKSREAYTGEEGYSSELGVNIYDYIKAITQDPVSIMDQNTKMEKSDIGGYQTTINTGLPALIAIAYREDIQTFIAINTCPGAGDCKVICYARGGQFGMNDGLIRKQIQRLNLLLNNPERYEKMLMKELIYWVNRVQKEGKKTGVDKKLVIRWNDSGDFFAGKYLEIAKRATYTLLNMGYNVRSYAYTKRAEYYNMGDENFVMNFSKGAKESEQSQLDFEKVKYSDVVPLEVTTIKPDGTEVTEPLFKDLFIMKKGAKYDTDSKTGLPQFVPGGKEELKRRISRHFKVPLETLIYQYELPREEQENFRYNTIVLPTGDSDISAQRHDVRITFLLIH